MLSLHLSTVKPDAIYVIDNGRDADRLDMALDVPPCQIVKHVPDKRMGVAEAWNWFLLNVPEERLIVNDDVAFAPDSLSKFLASSADLVWAEGLGFSCFLMRDACIEKVGYFDETISPGYGYYEDEDYLQRLDGHGTRAPLAVAENVDSGVRHAHSATLKAATHKEVLEHHRLFKVAQGNYVKKWHLEETFT
jgi:hypothetical protein